MTSITSKATPISAQEAVLAIYDTHAEAEMAIGQLQKGGFNMKNLSVVGKDYHTEEEVVGYDNAGDRLKYWGKWGAFWGGMWGLLFGAAFFWVPGVGPLLVAGPLAASVVAGLESAVVVGGLSAVGAALYSIGIPRDSILSYETAIRADKFLLVAHGTAAEVAQAKGILQATTPGKVEDHVLENAAPAGV